MANSYVYAFEQGNYEIESAEKERGREHGMG